MVELRQISRRFEIARAIGASNSEGLFEPEDGSSPNTTGFPQLSTQLYFLALESHLSAQRAARSTARAPRRSGTPIAGFPRLQLSLRERP